MIVLFALKDLFYYSLTILLLACLCLPSFDALFLLSRHQCTPYVSPCNYLPSLSFAVNFCVTNFTNNSILPTVSLQYKMFTLVIYFCPKTDMDMSCVRIFLVWISQEIFSGSINQSSWCQSNQFLHSSALAGSIFNK